jgi:hypothetical protein
MARSLITIGGAAFALAVACGGSSEDGLFGATGGAAGSGAGSGGAAGSGGCAGASSCAGSGGVAGAAGTTDGSAGAAGSSGASGAAGAAGSAGSAGEAGTAGSGGIGGSAGSGSAPTPGSILCGGAPCGLNLSLCCNCVGCSLPVPTQCYPKLTGCTTGTPMLCDDAADCKDNKLCCAHFQPPQFEFTGATCETKCPDEGNAQLCTTDGECPVGRFCKPLASLPGFKACQP